MAETTMVERSGRAALAASDIGISEDESYEDFDRRRSIAAGRAAIEAMREPTEVMMASCEQILSHFEGDYGDHNVYFRPHQAEEIWQAMIDAALAEEKPRG